MASWNSRQRSEKIPKQIADKLRNLEFRNWDHFRQTFWKEVANDPVLSKSFDPNDLILMKNLGKAPQVVGTQANGKLNSYLLHHRTPIHDGGKVYDIDNLLILTPRHHKEILEQGYHYGNKK